MRSLVILDLDETLICAVERSENRDIGIPKDCESYRLRKRFGPYWIYPRPGLQEFLSKLFKKYRVAVWTAAGSTYAMFVINTFITRRGRSLEFIQWSAHCDRSEEMFDHQKKLTMIRGVENGPMVLLDDAEHVRYSQPNVVNSRCWDVRREGAEEDDFLVTDALTEIAHKLRIQRDRKSRSKSRKSRSKSR
jgi:hypothetical protein